MFLTLSFAGISFAAMSISAWAFSIASLIGSLVSLEYNLRRSWRLMPEDFADDMQALVTHCHVTTCGASLMPSSA